MKKMKKIYVFIMFFFVFLNCSGQAMLGSMPSEIRKRFDDPEFHLESGYDEDGEYYLAVLTERAIVTYFFKGVNKPCYLTAIYPVTQGDLSFYVELYNKTCVIMSSTSWRKYFNKGFANISLAFDDENSYFLWSLPSGN